MIKNYHRHIKHTLILLVLLYNTTLSYSQYILDTPDGRKVKLNPDNTWEYILNKPLSETPGIPQGSTAKYTSSLRKFALWYNPNDWVIDTTLEKSRVFDWEVIFYSKDYSVTAFAMELRLALPTEKELVEEMLTRLWSPDYEVESIKISNDTINQLPLIFFEMDLEYGSIEYIYSGFFYTTPTGSFQFLVGTQRYLYFEEKEKIDQLIRGFAKL